MEDKSSELQKDFRNEMLYEAFVPHISTYLAETKTSWKIVEYCSSASLLSLTSRQPSFFYSLQCKAPSDKEYITLTSTQK